jgi:hypothetical protein
MSVSPQSFLYDPPEAEFPDLPPDGAPLGRAIKNYALAPKKLPPPPPQTDMVMARDLLSIGQLLAEWRGNWWEEDPAKKIMRGLLDCTETLFCLSGAASAIGAVFWKNGPAPTISPPARQALYELLGAERRAAAGPPEEWPTEAGEELSAPFVFTLENACACVALVSGVQADDQGWLHPPGRAEENLDAYVGGYLAQLDLSKSFITGSGAMSSALRPACYADFSSHAAFLASHYPPAYTEIDDPDSFCRWLGALSAEEFSMHCQRSRRNAPGAEWEGKCWLGGGHDVMKAFRYTLRVGADIDIAVDAEGEEFVRIAERHFGVVRRHFPRASLIRHDYQSGKCKFRIIEDPSLAGRKEEEPGPPRPAGRGFREIDIYPASWRRICWHHVGMVRLAYTAAPGGEARFYLASSCVLAALRRASPDYHYYASKKTTPQDVLLKYAGRGYCAFPLDFPAGVRAALEKYAQSSPFWNPARLKFLPLPGLKVYFESLPPIFGCRGLYNVENLREEMIIMGRLRRYRGPNWSQVLRPPS